MMMWFDPDRELPYVGHPSSDQRGREPYYEGGALDGTCGEEEGVPCEGREDKTSARGVKGPGDSPPGFLDAFGEGGPDGEADERT